MFYNAVMKLTKPQKPSQDSAYELKNEQQFVRDMIDSLHEGIILFNTELKIQEINQQALSLLHLTRKNPLFFKNICFFNNKKCTLKLNIKSWLKQALNHPTQKSQEAHVWVKLKHYQAIPYPISLSSKPISTKKDQFQGLLLVLHDRSISAQIEEQNRILEASFNSYDGQFITNNKGYIINPNIAFSAYTGLSLQELKKINIIQWIKKQVIFQENTHVDDVLMSLLTEKKWSGEVEIHPSKNTIFYSVLRLFMLVDKENNIEHYLGTVQDITDIKMAQSKIQHLAYYDDLTHLPNRRLLIEHIEQAISQHKQKHTYSALIYIDLDNFKELNDIYGHFTGDQALKYTAEILKSTLQTDNILARISGDEFAILTQSSAPNATTAIQQALTLSNKLLKTLSKNIIIADTIIPSSCSIGVCIFPLSDNETPERLINKTDLAMYEAKNLGRNQICFYKEELSQKILKRRELEDALKNASYEKEFHLVYQPQISTNKTISAEVLIRWNHPSLGFIPPDNFIKIAENNRQILKLGHWILQTAFNQIKKWNMDYDKEIHLSVNISPVQFQEEDFVKNLQKLQTKTGIMSKWITIELTEGILVSNINEVLNKIRILKDLGYKLSIDDFGTGYSSLSYFQKLPIHELKIDQSFVKNIPHNLDDVSIVNTIIQLAESKNLVIVAEGIETAEQAAFFTQHSANILLQGYFYSKPVKAKIFARNFLKP